ncbi:MAG: CRISPR-associated endonuclease Cas1 [Phascolarctobacterium sp.]|nr:CRISPR-associated endonuclease Cas1 [Phascolarctobacterium sp.]
MTTIYMTEHGVHVNKEGGTIAFKKKDGNATCLPSDYVSVLVVMANVQISHAVIVEVLRNNGRIVYLDKYGKIMGALDNRHVSGRNLLTQLDAYRDADRRLEIAKYILKEKISDEIKFLSYLNKRFKNEEITQVIGKLNIFKNKCDAQTDIASLMGIEGICAKNYFGCFQYIIKHKDFVWTGRKKHPPKDTVNALLSYTYVLVEKDVRAALAETELALDIGYLHAADCRKDSLVYDILELFRAGVADKFVLRCINLRIANAGDFTCEEEGCLMSRVFLKKFVAAYEDYVGDFNDSDSIRYGILQTVRKIKKMIMDSGEN